MNPYIPQLLSDIEALIQQPPSPPYYEVPPHLAETPDIAELALSPPTTLEEITGISIEMLPNILELEIDEWIPLAGALKRLLEALNINIADLPDNYPDDAFYDLVVTH